MRWKHIIRQALHIIPVVSKYIFNVKWIVLCVCAVQVQEEVADSRFAILLPVITPMKVPISRYLDISLVCVCVCVRYFAFGPQHSVYHRKLAASFHWV